MNRFQLLFHLSFALLFAACGDAPMEGEHEHGQQAGAQPAESAEEAVLWTCPMHAQVQLPDPVPCPICGMDLVVFDPNAGSELVLMESQVRVAQVETSLVERRMATRGVRLVGTVEADETTLTSISARVAGRLERLFVNYSGVSVNQGDHLAELYSPTLLSAQEELLAALARTRDTNSVLNPGSSQAAYMTARAKLELYGLDLEQINAIETEGIARDRITLRSPVTGTVLRRHGEEGAYVREGTPIYEVADLSHLWLELEAFEQDLPWLRYGQLASVQLEAIPGEVMEGTVSFIAPEVDRAKRTTTVRINLANPDGRLKPGMFAKAVVHARLGQSGVILPASLAGKWVGTMHPEVISDEPGACEVCGMQLQPAETLGLVDEGVNEPGLIIPLSAVLPTGRRAVVYVERKLKDGYAYEGREIVLGPRAGEFVQVRSGLTAGERVVSQGAFRIDSAMQIRGMPSVMSRPGEEGAPGPSGATLRASLQDFWTGVMDISASLAADQDERSLELAKALPKAFAKAQIEGLAARARRTFLEQRPALLRDMRAMAAAKDVKELRDNLGAFFDVTLRLATSFGVPSELGVREAHCPMAQGGTGGFWIQREGSVANPYFGARMLECGDLLRNLEAGQ
ncbi:MAG: Cu(I)/Ag(I) efflux system membrane fusion protein [Planctomycetota bacterium]|jgi:Cu(I)/Ag(I) efflux system membrane fusion protein